MDRKEKLEHAEHELRQLAAHLETVVGKDDDYGKAALALGHRARSLFLGFHELLEGAAPVAALTLMRPMVEINFLLRWLGQNPKLNVELWMAEGQRQRVAFFDDYARGAYLVERWGPPPEEQTEVREWLRTEVQGMRKSAVEAGADVEKGPLIPPAGKLVRILNDPGAQEAYTLGYRRLSADIHAGMQAFEKGAFILRLSDVVSYSEPQDPDLFGAERTLVVTMFASTLCILSAVLGLDIHDRADAVKQRFMLPGEPPIAERMRSAQAGPQPAPDTRPRSG